MDLKELELEASKNNPLPKNLSQIKQLYYLSMRSLYHEYHRSYISKSQAKSDRNFIIQKYKEAESIENSQRKLFQYVDNIRVAFGGQFKKVEQSGCPICRNLVRILDGRHLYEEDKEK